MFDWLIDRIIDRVMARMVFRAEGKIEPRRWSGEVTYADAVNRWEEVVQASLEMPIRMERRRQG